MTGQTKRVLITGAGGFIGGFLVAEALSRGYETWAAVRATTNRRFLTDERIRFIELDFTNPDTLRDTLNRHIEQHGTWHAVVHNLGLTKATNYLEFEQVNFGYLRSFVETLRELNALPENFLLMSSLSVMGPGDEVNYTPFKPTDVPLPNTRYGTSKLKAETFLQSQPDMGWTIFRCTGVYGPHERDYYLMLKSIKTGFDFTVGFKRQMLTFIYVRDLAEAVFNAIERGPLRKAYFISEPRGYTQAEFRKLACRMLNKRFVIPVKCPLWVVNAVCHAAQWIANITSRPSTLNPDKYHILKQRNWLCDTSDAQRDFGFNPKYDLERGLTETIEWYRAAGWL